MGTLLNSKFCKTNSLLFSKHFVFACTLLVILSVAHLDNCTFCDPNKLTLWIIIWPNLCLWNLHCDGQHKLVKVFGKHIFWSVFFSYGKSYIFQMSIWSVFVVFLLLLLLFFVALLLDRYIITLTGWLEFDEIFEHLCHLRFDRSYYSTWSTRVYRFYQLRVDFIFKSFSDMDVANSKT